MSGTTDALGTNEVEVALALAAELQMTLCQDVVDGHAVQSGESCTGADFVHVTSSFRGISTRLQQQLGSVEQGLGIAVDALVVIVVQVLRGWTVLVVPEPDTTQTDLTGTDRERLNQSDSDDDNETDDENGITKELAITPEMRQLAFDNYETTDDHCMHITGYLTDRNGTRYLKVKNSWGEELSRNGYIYMSEAFFRYKTLNITVHKDAVPADIKNKLNL